MRNLGCHVRIPAQSLSRVVGQVGSDFGPVGLRAGQSSINGLLCWKCELNCCPLVREDGITAVQVFAPPASFPARRLRSHALA